MPSNEQHLIQFIQTVVEVLLAMDARMEDALRLLARIDERTSSMSNEMNALRAAVEREESAQKSVVIMLNGIAQLIRDNAANPAVLQLLADQINRDADGLVAAAQANTDVAPNPSPATAPRPAGSGASALNPSTPDPTPSNPTPATTPNSGVRPPAQDPQNPAVPLGTSQVAPEAPPTEQDNGSAPGPVSIPPPEGQP